MYENQKIILKGIGGFYYVKTADGILECRVKGIFRKRGISPVAGDAVVLEQEAGTNIIAEILPRKNVFTRPPIANVDNFFIVVSTVQPVPSTLVIDKLTAIAVDKETQPIIVVTKTDLHSAQTIAECYRHSGIPLLCVDAATGKGMDEMRARLPGKLSVFCGNSGVGKSTLLGTLLPEITLETGEISKKLGRGRHTTREVTLYEACGGYVADTPGFSSLDMEKASRIPKENLQYAFLDLKKYFGQCKFTGCSHTVEKGCAVRAALAEGKLDKSRYVSYVTLYNEAKEISDWQR
ncbi:MAG: ribosome small subunit-dependent GTPase A [Ruthenibacterium sp.]